MFKSYIFSTRENDVRYLQTTVSLIWQDETTNFNC